MILPKRSDPPGQQVILFDLDGTLRHNRPDANNTLFDCAVALGAHDAPENRRRASRWAHYYWAHSSELHNDMQRFPEHDQAFWENYTVRKLQAFGCTEEQARQLAPAVRQYMADNYQPEDYIPEEVPGLLENLQADGFTLGLITNRSQPVDAYLAETGLEDYFCLALAAGEINQWKPEPGIFQFALKHLGASPQNTVYIGDNYYADVLGARRAGIYPVLYDPQAIFLEMDCTVISQLADLRGIVHQA
jgi:putative hydrolase of the HAD superfamily